MYSGVPLNKQWVSWKYILLFHPTTYLPQCTGPPAFWMESHWMAPFCAALPPASTDSPDSRTLCLSFFHSLNSSFHLQPNSVCVNPAFLSLLRSPSALILFILVLSPNNGMPFFTLIIACLFVLSSQLCFKFLESRPHTPQCSLKAC